MNNQQGTESAEQMALFRWATLQSGKHPELNAMYHIPNGGMRHKATAARLKAEGLKAGVPDICLPVPMGKYAGLYVELKVGKNKPTKLQQEWLDTLASYGHKAVVCYGWEDAMKVILDYIKGGRG